MENFENKTTKQGQAMLEIVVAGGLRKNDFLAKTLVRMPEGVYDGYAFYIASGSAAKLADNRLKLSIDAGQTYKLRCSGKDDVALTGRQLYEALKAAACEDDQSRDKSWREKEYFRRKRDECESETEFIDIVIPENGKIADYKKEAMFKMPRGECEGYAYVIPKRYIKEDEVGEITLSLPKDYIITVSNGRTGKRREFDAEEFAAMVRDKSKYNFAEYKEPQEIMRERFDKLGNAVDAAVPEEMKSRPNWVAVRFIKNKESGVTHKIFVSPATGEYADAEKPQTWTDYAAASEYARNNICDTLAYALDGKDGVCCLDISDATDGCGNLTEKTKSMLRNMPDTYCERSVSGKDIHLLGRTEGLDVRPFSKDNSCEFYQKNRFVTLTGNLISGNNGIKSLDAYITRKFLESMFEKRTELDCGSGIDWLMFKDREVYEKASDAKGGEKFRALFRGENVANNYDCCVAMLSNRLIEWCKGDKEQALRLLLASGFYRRDKSLEYYECVVIRSFKTMKRIKEKKDGKQI